MNLSQTIDFCISVLQFLFFSFEQSLVPCNGKLVAIQIVNFNINFRLLTFALGSTMLGPWDCVRAGPRRWDVNLTRPASQPDYFSTVQCLFKGFLTFD